MCSIGMRRTTVAERQRRYDGRAPWRAPCARAAFVIAGFRPRVVLDASGRAVGLLDPARLPRSSAAARRRRNDRDSCAPCEDALHVGVDDVADCGWPGQGGAQRRGNPGAGTVPASATRIVTTVERDHDDDISDGTRRDSGARAKHRPQTYRRNPISFDARPGREAVRSKDREYK